MRREWLELTDTDLVRLARLGGSVERIAEAAGIGAEEVRRRLAVLEPGLLHGDRPTTPAASPPVVEVTEPARSAAVVFGVRAGG